MKTTKALAGKNKSQRKDEGTFAVVLSGGGARGAYEAGVIHFIRTQLSQKARNKRFDIYTGASVGAINACFMGATAHDLPYQGAGIYHFWRHVSQSDVYQHDLKALLSFLKHTSKGLITNLSFGVNRSQAHYRGLLNSAPLLSSLSRAIDFPQITKNIRDHASGAIALVATNVSTGATELFIDKNPSVNYTGIKDIHLGPIKPVHAMASAAIPLVFPAVLIEGTPYIDGGLRLNTPLSPSIQLGADHILSIGLHHGVEKSQPVVCNANGCHPTLGQLLGRVMNTVFLDRTRSDVEQLQRINRIIEWSENCYGMDFLQNINQQIINHNYRGDIAERGLKKINILSITPSQDIAQLFLECYYKENAGKKIAFMERFLARILDVSPESGADFLSYLAFIPSFLNALLELGFEDARSQAGKLENFLNPEATVS